jgi:hypothetical protein
MANCNLEAGQAEDMLLADEPRSTLRQAQLTPTTRNPERSALEVLRIA